MIETLVTISVVLFVTCSGDFLFLAMMVANVPVKLRAQIKTASLERKTRKKKQPSKRRDTSVQRMKSHEEDKEKIQKGNMVLKHQYASSPYCSRYISYGICKENLSNNQELLEFEIISVILMNLLLASVATLLGEIRRLSLLGLKS